MMLARLGDWLDERIGHRALLDRALGYRVAGGARWSSSFGSALATLFALELVTGLLLMTSYAPTAQTAWASVHFITYRLAAGWILRGLHYFASQAMIALVAAHLVQTAIAAAYRRPREVTWWVGVVLMLLTILLSHTGFMLPWDQKGYWGARMATSIAGTSPLIGGWVQRLIQGGSDYGTLTLTRLYTLHVGVLPLLVLALVFGHVALVRRHGVTVARGRDPARSVAFFPSQAARDLTAAIVVTLLLFAVVLDRHGASLDAPADPNDDFPARPEWYLTPIFELRKHMHGPLELVATMGVPAIVFGYLFALPLLDRAPGATLRARMKWLWPLFAGLAGCAALLVVSLRADARDPAFVKARARADAYAETAARLAMNGVPPAGPLDMLARDPELRGRALFGKTCASCHVMGDLGDREKATAPVLDGWGTEAWVSSMLDDPDARGRFGKTAFEGMMPSMLRPPPDRKPGDPPFSAMKDADVKAVSVFLASLSDDDAAGPGVIPAAPKPARDAAQVKAGESIVSVRCTSCHLWKGEGDDSGQGYAPELLGWGTPVWLRAQLANPATKATYREDALSAKMKGHMPRFDGDLGAADVDLLARWVVAHAHGKHLE